jgi:hypothetical protein
LFAGYIHLLLLDVLELLDHHLVVLLQYLYQHLFQTVGLGIRNHNNVYELLELRHHNYRYRNQDSGPPWEPVVELVDNFAVELAVGKAEVLVGTVAVQQEPVGLLCLPTNCSLHFLHVYIRVNHIKLYGR